MLSFIFRLLILAIIAGIGFLIFFVFGGVILLVGLVIGGIILVSPFILLLIAIFGKEEGKS